MVCAQLKPAVSGLEKEFPGITAQNVSNTTPEAKADAQALGFKSHGLVIKDKSGKVLFSQADHEVQMDVVRSALKSLTEAGSKADGQG